MHGIATFEVGVWAPDWDQAETDARGDDLAAMETFASKAWRAGFPTSEIAVGMSRRWGFLGTIGFDVVRHGKGANATSKGTISIEHVHTEHETAVAASDMRDRSA